MIIPSYEIHVRLMIRFHCPDSMVEPLLSLLVRLIFSDIVMILRWSYSRCIGSHITISMEYMSDLLYIPMELFLSYQGISGTSDVMLGHISLI